ncbi:hypothetical protein FA04_28725 (plasmid) [Ensifer adhaerens]|nr:hypothetical protein FA04_28725 [Ensifer adhaerens]KDP71836.1 hypothetical protein FA04_20595 [Ensifer adhaerens]KQX24963.1 hypothetical protein ASD01_26675 [Ensifer sp. Root423]KQZ58812.1 hypothetical protein ASD63_04870 [Ensifer sp. Root558]OWZ89548.1 hypothetical protein B9J07_32535 [Sinorhizobium sp. LM21]
MPDCGWVGKALPQRSKAVPAKKYGLAGESEAMGHFHEFQIRADREGVILIGGLRAATGEKRRRRY